MEGGLGLSLVMEMAKYTQNLKTQQFTSTIFYTVGLTLSTLSNFISAHQNSDVSYFQESVPRIWASDSIPKQTGVTDSLCLRKKENTKES